MKRFFIGLVHMYRAGRFWIPSACKYTPTCSQYALTALKRHRLPVALQLIGKRILRCHPFAAGGIDPVPE